MTKLQIPRNSKVIIKTFLYDSFWRHTVSPKQIASIKEGTVVDAVKDNVKVKVVFFKLGKFSLYTTRWYSFSDPNIEILLEQAT